ncbi:hypothetical protein QCA50_014777 [Cerrena zonata]|uniref:Uncharacterized protein n=1 Tax=Cerrena zonata TaxID=2478898 RepID=A0AAW0FTL2_9APHY
MASVAPSGNAPAPQPASLFNGRVDTRMAAAVVYRLSRIGRALTSLVAGDVGNDKRRRRWRIGLYYEFTILKRTIGDLMVSGCQGGPLFTIMHFPWLEKHSDDAFIINWSTIGPLSSQIPMYPWIYRHIAPELLSENEWWRYHAQNPTPNVSRPPWWDCDEAAVPVTIYTSKAGNCCPPGGDQEYSTILPSYAGGNAGTDLPRLPARDFSTNLWIETRVLSPALAFFELYRYPIQDSIPGPVPLPDGPSRQHYFKIAHLEQSTSIILAPRLSISGYHPALLSLSSRLAIQPSPYSLLPLKIANLKYHAPR